MRSPHPTADTQADCCRNCQRNESIIESLKSELNQLKESVKSLTSQVEMLTSSLGLKSADMTTSSQSQLSQSSVLNNTTAAAAVKSYASVAANPSRTIRDVQLSIVSAVYKDKEDRRKHANNIFVSGLTIDEPFDSKAVVAGMILQKFSREVTVKSCRPLGTVICGDCNCPDTEWQLSQCSSDMCQKMLCEFAVLNGFIILFQTNDKGRLAPLTCHECGTSSIIKSLNSKNTNEKNTT